MNLKSRYNEIKDLSSYKDKLNEEELDWLDRFSHEYVCGNFNHGGEVLHDTPELRKACYGNNNRRNRDITSQEEAKNSMKSTDAMADHWHSREVLNEALKTNIFDNIKKRKKGKKNAKKSKETTD